MAGPAIRLASFLLHRRDICQLAIREPPSWLLGLFGGITAKAKSAATAAGKEQVADRDGDPK